ncbi:MAG TPA: hypothetical protein PKA06_08020, partial [Gemmatales bacterium]|nr:hypothetical protein [Gemmatales bacterium]
MSGRDLKILGITLIPVLLLLLFTYLAPVYYLPRGEYVRHWRWNAPTYPVRHGYDELSKEDLERINQDPRQREILEGMKNLPREIEATPIYVGSRRGPGRNTLGYLAISSLFLWCFYAGAK